MYKESGWLPRFPYLGGNVPCMIGHHTVSILAESAAKGVEFDLELAYEAAYKNATKRTMLPWKDGEAEELTQCYYDNGFFPGLEEDEEETLSLIHIFNLKADKTRVNMEPKQFIPGLDIPMMYREMYLASEGYLWEMVQRGNVDMEQMERDFSKLLNFWKSIYLQKK